MIILLATQRSGTNMLRRILANHIRVHGFPELFNDSYQGKGKLIEGVNFYEEYFLNQVCQKPELSLPKNRQEVVETYFDCIDTALKILDKVGIVDVKYNSLHHANGVWQTPSNVPNMLNIFNERGYKVIHLTRSDYMAVIFSLYRAQAVGQYMVGLDTIIEPVKFRINYKVLLDELEIHEQNASLIQHWLNKSGIEYLNVEYEDLFLDDPDSTFDAKKFQEILKFVDVNHVDFYPKATTQKISSRDFRIELENFDELERKLRGSRHHADLVRTT
jgi:hypothetical protein